MKAIPTAIPDVVIIEPRIFGDERGFFFENFNGQQFDDLTKRDADFVLDSHSRSVKDVFRWLHYQIQQPQGKLVRVVHGVVFGVAVDIRISSPTFGQNVAVAVSAENKRMGNDQAIGIQWPIQGEPTEFAKDRQAKTLTGGEHFV